jgi:hypothetical protein
MYLNDDGADWQEIVVGMGPFAGTPIYADILCCNACATPVTEREELYPTLIYILIESREG